MLTKSLATTPNIGESWPKSVRAHAAPRSFCTRRQLRARPTLQLWTSGFKKSGKSGPGLARCVPNSTQRGRPSRRQRRNQPPHQLRAPTPCRRRGPTPLRGPKIARGRRGTRGVASGRRRATTAARRTAATCRDERLPLRSTVAAPARHEPNLTNSRPVSTERGPKAPEFGQLWGLDSADFRPISAGLVLFCSVPAVEVRSRTRERLCSVP